MDREGNPGAVERDELQAAALAELRLCDEHACARLDEDRARLVAESGALA